MQKTSSILFCVLGLIIGAPSVHAKVFRNAYVSFELNDAWSCTLEATEWVCRSSSDKESREAIIILTAKEVGPSDSFEAYKTHLNTPQPVAYKGAGGGGVSRIVYPPKLVQINDHQWADGLHLASEVPNYYTRYLATLKDRIAILVTFSAHKDVYARYSQDFFRSVMTLRVIATKNLLAKPEMGPIRPSGETLGAPISAAMPTDMAAFDPLTQGGGAGGSSTRNLFLAIAALLTAIGGYLYFKSRSN